MDLYNKQMWENRDAHLLVETLSDYISSQIVCLAHQMEQVNSFRYGFLSSCLILILLTKDRLEYVIFSPHASLKNQSKCDIQRFRPHSRGNQSFDFEQRNFQKQRTFDGHHSLAVAYLHLGDLSLTILYKNFLKKQCPISNFYKTHDHHQATTLPESQNLSPSRLLHLSDMLSSQIKRW